MVNLSQFGGRGKFVILNVELVQPKHKNDRWISINMMLTI